MNYKEIATKLKNAKSFEEVLDIDVKHLVEKKGKFDYISWPHLQAIGKIAYGKEFSWSLIKVIETNANQVLVEVEVSIKGDKQTLAQPVIDFNNKGIENPTSFEINKAIMRGFAKAFSMLTGLGLVLWIGEDLPEDNTRVTPTQPKLASEKQRMFLAQLISNLNDIQRQGYGVSLPLREDLLATEAYELINKLKS